MLRRTEPSKQCGAGASACQPIALRDSVRVCSLTLFPSRDYGERWFAHRGGPMLLYACLWAYRCGGRPVCQPPPAFEVASVKTKTCGPRIQHAVQRVRRRGRPISRSRCKGSSHAPTPCRVTSPGPDWIGSESYDIYCEGSAGGRQLPDGEPVLDRPACRALPPGGPPGHQDMEALLMTRGQGWSQDAPERPAALRLSNHAGRRHSPRKVPATMKALAPMLGGMLAPARR